MSNSSQNQPLQTKQTVLEFPTLRHGGRRLPNLLLWLVDCLLAGARRHNCYAKSSAIEDLPGWRCFAILLSAEMPDRLWQWTVAPRRPG